MALSGFFVAFRSVTFIESPNYSGTFGGTKDWSFRYKHLSFEIYPKVTLANARILREGAHKSVQTRK